MRARACVRACVLACMSVCVCGRVGWGEVRWRGQGVYVRGRPRAAVSLNDLPLSFLVSLNILLSIMRSVTGAPGCICEPQ